MKKIQVFSLTLFALLTFASVKTASSAPPPSALADAPAGTEVSLDDFLCNLNQTASIELPGSTPAPNPAGEVCGTCGQDICDNRNVGTWCGYVRDQYGFYHNGYCIPPWGGTCVDDRPNCQCATEYQ